MAFTTRIGGRTLSALQTGSFRKLTTSAGLTSGRNILRGVLGVASVGAAGTLYALEHSVRADDLPFHAPHFHWSHDGFMQSLDHASIRRGYQVYKQVCAACHSLRYIAYRHLVGVSHTEEEAKAEAAEAMIKDGPDATGEMFERSGKLFDYFPSPYPNEEAARHANNGAYPPDLSLISLARHGGENYLFALLTGYCEPPAGVELKEGQYYNPYFPGGALGMGQMLFDESIEYEDGTPATASQLAKDVSVFLKWCSEPEHDERKFLSLKIPLLLGLLTGMAWYINRTKWASVKSRKIVFVPKKYD